MTKPAITATLTIGATICTAVLIAQTVGAPTPASVTAQAARESIHPQVICGPPAAAMAITSVPGRLDTLPADPFRRCATKALRGDFGTLKLWQECAYRWGLANGLTVPAGNRSKVTPYGKWEPCGDYTASGDEFNLDFVSVPPKHIALGWIIWTPWGLAYAMDTGGAVKARKPYIRSGENMNLDYATAKGRATERKMPWVVVKKKTSWNWYGERKWGDYTKKGQR